MGKEEQFPNSRSSNGTTHSTTVPIFAPRVGPQVIMVEEVEEVQVVSLLSRLLFYWWCSGQGGGGHGGYYDPTQPNPHPFNTNPNYAEDGVTHTGGGGGGNRGPYGTYYAGNGGSGIVIIRYSYP